MTWNYAYTSAIWSPFLTVFFLLSLPFMVGGIAKYPGLCQFLIGNLFSALSVAGYAKDPELPGETYSPTQGKEAD